MMDKFTLHSGVAAPIMRNNINTDAIIPSREMKTVSKTGLAKGLFAPWRYLDAEARSPDPNFVLNQAKYTGASILISGNNFGCGSSREHAVWALKEYGIRCIIAEGFGNIFFRNCVSNGILPIKLKRDQIEQIIDHISPDPQLNHLTINLQQSCIYAGEDQYSFSAQGSDREMLLEGLDPIAVTLKMQALIESFQKQDAQSRPWMYSQAEG